MKYPNKHTWRNILLIFAAILLVGGSFLAAEYRNKNAQNVYVAKDLKISNSEISDTPSEIDTDGDGSKDWEEILAGSNPNDPKSKPDTIKAPITSDLTKNAPEKLDQIDLVSRQFFAKYMEMRQTGNSKDLASRKDLAQATAQSIVLGKPDTYTIQEILTQPDSGNAGVQVYGDQIGEIFKKYLVQSRNEAIIAKEAVTKENPSLLKEIDPTIVSYQNIIKALTKVRVPQSAATLHLDLINSMNGVLFVAQSFRNSGVNAVEGVQAVAYYQQTQQSLLNSINGIKSYLKYLGLNENIF